MDILEEKLGAGRIQLNKNISPYLTLHTKNIAEYYFEAESKEDVVNSYKAAVELGIPYLIIGGGSNLVITQHTVSGLVVRNMYKKMELLKDSNESVEVLISSGYPIARLVTETAAKGWEGFEYHLGLPGTLGGGIAMNSKWYVDREPVYMGDSLIKGSLLTQSGELKEVNRDYFEFSYDYSILKDTKEVFVEGVFKLKKNNPEVLKQRAKDANEFRRKTQVVGEPTCGCMFQNVSEEEKKIHNLPTTSAGYLIDKAGLKQKQIGNFIVSQEHANFIINKGEGNPQDLLSLMQLIKKTVKEKYNIELQEEVMVI